MAKKYYAVKNGRKTGIFLSWDECKVQVHGYPGAVYKSFPTKEEAQNFVSGESILKKISDSSGNKPKTADGAVPESAEKAIAYVDGSYHPASKAFSCGAILFWQGETVRFSQKFTDPEMAEMRNVAGEIMGSAAVIDYCLEKKIPAIEIYHDYEGVAKWAEGLWKTNKNGTKAYAKKCREAAEKLSISFVKVKGHSGDKYNDEADRLAKAALGII
jgi:Predicted double-stranded RNA/RNA-DNA hybrid binding protein